MAAANHYWCHECRKEFTLVPPPNQDIECISYAGDN